MGQPHNAVALSVLPDLLSVRELASVLRMHPNSIYELVRRNEIPGVLRIGPKRIMFSRAAVARWIAGEAAA